MPYPEICELWCKNFGSDGCPNSSLCMATENKPYFAPRVAPKTLFEKLTRKRKVKRICKAHSYNCSECIYHEYIFDGAIYRGTKCRLERSGV